MQLFKRFLLSYFPESTAKDAFNPASMFVSFISAKDFFNIIDRKIIENFKLNFFDVSNDIFEGRLWLWVWKEIIQWKTAETYFSYLSAANFNGYKFYNIWNTATSLSLIIAMYIYDAFDDWEEWLFVDSLYTFYLLSFLLAGRIKVFPWLDEKSDFQRYLDLYFDFYQSIARQLKHKVLKKRFLEIKNNMLTHIEIFFMMFYYSKRLNQFIFNPQSSWDTETEEFYNWLLENTSLNIKKEFFSNFKETIYIPKILETEQNILFDIAPADIHLKYIFLGTDTSEIVNSLLPQIFDKNLLNQKLLSLVKNSKELDFIVDYATDIENFKKNYFIWIKQYIAHFRMSNKDSFDELDEMMSEIWDDFEKLDQSQIPNSIKKESQIMEQLLNFYISFLWWLTISRAESFFLRFFKTNLLQELSKHIEWWIKKESSAIRYTFYQMVYIKNLAYYKYVSKNVRSWKEKFFIPSTPLESQYYDASNFLTCTKNEIAITTLLQDFNPQLWKLYIKNKSLLLRFQNEYSNKISSLIKKKNSDFIRAYYKQIFGRFKWWDDILSILENAFTDQDVSRLKNSLYSFDVQLFDEIINNLPRKEIEDRYDETVILHTLANIRETFLWFLIYFKYLEISQLKDKQDYHLQEIKEIYFQEILHLDKWLLPLLIPFLDDVNQKFWNVITLFMEFDDNKEFFAILKDNWLEFLKRNKKKTLYRAFSFEDILRLLGVLKHITYYNKRYLIPN